MVARRRSAAVGHGRAGVAGEGVAGAGVAGALIGYSLVELQCSGDCAVPLGLGILIGAFVTAGGMSIVAVLVLRAVGEWREIQDRQAR